MSGESRQPTEGRGRPLIIEFRAFTFVLGFISMAVQAVQNFSYAILYFSPAGVTIYFLLLAFQVALNIVAFRFLQRADRRFYTMSLVGLSIDLLFTAYSQISHGNAYTGWAQVLVGAVWLCVFYFSKSASHYFGVIHMHWFTTTTPSSTAASSTVSVASMAPITQYTPPVAMHSISKAKPRKNKSLATAQYTFDQITSAIQSLLTIRDMDDDYNGDYKDLVKSGDDVPPIIALLMVVSSKVTGERNKDELLVLLRGYLPTIGLDDRHYMKTVDCYKQFISLHARLDPREYNREQETVNAAAKHLTTKGPAVNYELKTFCDVYFTRYLENFQQLRGQEKQGRSVLVRRWQMAGLIGVLVATIVFAVYSQYRVFALEESVQTYVHHVDNLNGTIEAQEQTITDQKQDYFELLGVKNQLAVDYDRVAPKADFMDTHVALVNSNMDGIYHTYNCRMLANFYTYTVEEAEYMGYVPCTACH